MIIQRPNYFPNTSLDDRTLTPILSNEEHDEDGDILTAKREKLEKPPLYKVLLHNDDYTTMEFVILVLKSVFNKTGDAAESIMLKVHNEGVGLCGIFTKEISEMKVDKVMKMAKKEGHPLMCTMEPE